MRNQMAESPWFLERTASGERTTCVRSAAEPERVLHDSVNKDIKAVNEAQLFSAARDLLMCGILTRDYLASFPEDDPGRRELVGRLDQALAKATDPAYRAP